MTFYSFDVRRVLCASLGQDWSILKQRSENDIDTKTFTPKSYTPAFIEFSNKRSIIFTVVYAMYEQLSFNLNMHGRKPGV